MTGRRLLFLLHLYVGLIIGPVVVISGLTGSVLVFREEIDAFLNPDLLRAVPGSHIVPLEEILETVQRVFPEARPFSIRLPLEAQNVYEIRLNGNTGLRVYVDPYSGVILGERRPDRKLMDVLFYVHSELLGGKYGKIAIGTAAVLFLLPLATGLVLWWPGWRRLGQGFRIRVRGRGAVRMTYDIHKVTGAVATGLLALVAVTGVSLVFHSTFEQALNWITATPPRPASARSTVPLENRRIPLDRILAVADEALPGASTTWVMLPLQQDGTVRVRKKFPQELHPNGKSFVSVDQYSGRVLQIEDALTAPPARWFDNLLYPLHIGRWGGIGSEVIYVTIGVIPAILFVTGWMMWRNRRTAKR